MAMFLWYKLSKQNLPTQDGDTKELGRGSVLPGQHNSIWAIQCKHNARLSTVMSRLAEANVKLNHDKCVFRQKELTSVPRATGQVRTWCAPSVN